MEENPKDYECEARKLYFKVLEKFPSISKEDGKISIDQKTLFAHISVEYDEHSYKPKLRFNLIIDNLLFTLPEDWREAIIAHELGHYCQITKNFNARRFKRQVRWAECSDFYYNHRDITDVLKFLNKKHVHREKRVQKWFIMREIYADNKALEAGYGYGILSLLKSYRGIYFDSKESDERINNLEHMLGI